jgi:molecular chaperone DnaK
MIVGIDLGTSTSEIAYLKHGRPVLIREVGGARHGILPSVVAVGSGGEIVVGEPAEKLLVPRPGSAVQEVKRLMGTSQLVTLDGEAYTPQEISAHVLRHLKDEAEKYLGEPITEAVITVPAYFNELERHATRDAGEIAGLTVRRIINEPTAAALAYGIQRPGVEEKVVVYDLGGGTLDVTVLELSEGILDVLASTGDNRLGGKDFDERLMGFLREECLRACDVDLFGNARLKERLKAAARGAKETLSSADSTRVVIDYVGMREGGEAVDFEYELTRARFESLIRSLVEGTRRQLDEALAAKEVRPEEVDTVLLVGGSTRIPLVRAFVSEYFGGKALRTEVDPVEAVALGAAVLTGIEDRTLGTDDVLITDVAPHTFGVATLGQVDGEWNGDVFDPIIRKNLTIPRTERSSYSTVADFQQSVHVRVYQGDSRLCKDNLLVGDFVFEPLTPAPAGQEIEIEMSYNLDGNIETVAREARTGREVRHQMAATPLRLSDSDKMRARARMSRPGSGFASPRPAAPAADTPAPAAEAWRDSPLYERVKPLLVHTEKRLADLPAGVRARAVGMMDQLKAALAAGDAEGVRRGEEILTNLLFELD